MYSVVGHHTYGRGDRRQPNRQQQQSQNAQQNQHQHQTQHQHQHSHCTSQLQLQSGSNFSVSSKRHNSRNRQGGEPLTLRLLNYLKKRFNPVVEFKKWKLNLEKESKCMFVKNYQSKKLKNGIISSTYFCHRSFNFRIHRKIESTLASNSNRQSRKKTKNIGTNKLDFTCPAKMTVHQENNNVTVTYNNIHLGHECEPARMRLDSDIRSLIAGKLSLGVPVKKVIGDIRNDLSIENVEDDCGGLTRLHLLSNDDVYNIKHSFNITCPIQKHQNDSTSVECWVEEMKKQTNNPVLMYKNQTEDMRNLNREDFVLIIMSEFQKKMLKKLGPETICIDGTHGTNQYKFQLYTLLTIDEWGEGVPIAFCISNREDETIFRIFFSCIKDQVGKMSTKVFMSDGAEAFYNAWSAEMGEAEKRLLCLWHIQKNWVINQKKIKREDKRRIVLKSLTSISEELNEEAFESEFVKLLENLELDEDTREFGVYLRQNYVNNRKSWARCYRRYVPINTNMCLEALHRSLKYDYLDGKKCFRIDRTVHELLCIIRGKRFSRIRKIAKNTPYKNTHLIVASHEKSSSYLNEVQPHPDPEVKNCWIVKEYTVTLEKLPGEKTQCCKRVCETCKICVHTYVCTCRNNVLNFNICKHIHAVATKHPIDSDENLAPISLEMEMEDNIMCLPSSLRNAKDINDEVALKNEIIYGLLKTKKPSPDQGEELIKLQNKILSILHQSEDRIYALEQQDLTRGKIQKQSYFSTRKAPTKKQAKLPYTSGTAKQIIQRGFQSASDKVVEVVNILDTEDFDHPYGANIIPPVKEKKNQNTK